MYFIQVAYIQIHKILYLFSQFFLVFFHTSNVNSDIPFILAHPSTHQEWNF